MKTALKASVLTLLTAFIFSTSANAQLNASASHNVSMTLSDIITMTFSGTADLNIALSSVADYTSGKASGTRTLVVNSNKAYTITAYASSSATTSGDLKSGLGGADIPLSALTVKEGSGSYGAISATSGTPTTIVSHAAGGNVSHTITYFANPGFGFVADTYTTNVTYTATQQ
jgi:hypothetical protein